MELLALDLSTWDCFDVSRQRAWPCRRIRRLPYGLHWKQRARVLVSVAARAVSKPIAGRSQIHKTFTWVSHSPSPPKRAASLRNDLRDANKQSPLRPAALPDDKNIPTSVNWRLDSSIVDSEEQFFLGRPHTRYRQRRISNVTMGIGSLYYFAGSVLLASWCCTSLQINGGAERSRTMFYYIRAPPVIDIDRSSDFKADQICRLVALRGI